MVKAKVFTETYNSYLKRLREVDLGTRAKSLGAHPISNGIRIQFFNKEYVVNHEGIECQSGGSTSFAVKVVLCQYILMSCAKERKGNSALVTFRDFKDSSPLHSYFTNNTNKTIEQSFTGNLQGLRDTCILSGGVELQSSGFDVSFTFLALPKIPVLLHFNDKDELFPAKSSLLYRLDAEQYLDMECLAITGTFLSGLLIGKTS